MFLPLSPIDLEPFKDWADANIRIQAALGGELGEYFEGTESFPAIYVVVDDPEGIRPINYKCTGLEVLIFPPEITGFNTKCLYHNTAIFNLWEVRLIQHDRTKTTFAAYLKLIQTFPDIERLSFQESNRNGDEQLNLLITQPIFTR